MILSLYFLSLSDSSSPKPLIQPGLCRTCVHVPGRKTRNEVQGDDLHVVYISVSTFSSISDDDLPLSDGATYLTQ